MLVFVSSSGTSPRHSSSFHLCLRFPFPHFLSLSFFCCSIVVIALLVICVHELVFGFCLLLVPLLLWVEQIVYVGHFSFLCSWSSDPNIQKWAEPNNNNSGRNDSNRAAPKTQQQRQQKKRKKKVISMIENPEWFRSGYTPFVAVCFFSSFVCYPMSVWLFAGIGAFFFLSLSFLL
jgi:hypothetical protein